MQVTRGQLWTLGFFFFLAVTGLSCGTWDLQSLLWHMRSLVVACGIISLHWGMQTLFFFFEGLEKEFYLFFYFNLI